MWCEIVDRKILKDRRAMLVRLEDEDGNTVVPEKLRSVDGITYRVIRKPEHGDFIEIRPDGGKWGVFKDQLEAIPCGAKQQ